MADVLSQIPGLAGYLAMQNQRRQAAAQEFQNVSGLAAALRQQEQADREAQMAPLKMQALQAELQERNLAMQAAQKKQEFFSPRNMEQYMTPGQPAVAPGQGVTGGMDEGGLGQMLGVGPTEQGAPAAQPGVAPRLDVDRLIAGGVSQGVLNPEAMINRQSQIEQRMADREARRQDMQMRFDQENRTLAERQAFEAQQARERASDREYMLRVAASLRPSGGGGGGEKLSVVQTDQGMMLTDGRGNFRPAVGPDGKQLRAPVSASEARVQRDLQKQEVRDEGIKSRLNLVLEKVDEALKNTGILSAGFIGGTMAGIRGTPAYDLEKTVDTIKANIGFQELQAMRDASPTGGALGQVAVKELDMLQATLSSIEVGQSPAQLRSNLLKIKTHYQNWLKTLEKPKTADETNTPGRTNSPGAVPRISNDADYNALPSGSQYIAPDGKTRTKQ
jgi:hypothetical protein